MANQRMATTDLDELDSECEARARRELEIELGMKLPDDETSFDLEEGYESSGEGASGDDDDDKKGSAPAPLIPVDEADDDVKSVNTQGIL